MQQTVNASPKFETFSVSTSFGACRYERCFLDAKGWHCVLFFVRPHSIKNRNANIINYLLCPIINMLFFCHNIQIFENAKTLFLLTNFISQKVAKLLFSCSATYFQLSQKRNENSKRLRKYIQL